MLQVPQAQFRARAPRFASRSIPKYNGILFVADERAHQRRAQLRLHFSGKVGAL
jgi:hypothetical protein